MKALGMIEVYGYLTAVEALDRALKTANVTFVNLGQAKGGMVSVFVSGDVAAVQAAMEAARTAAGQVGRIVSVHVIPRPADGIVEKLISRQEALVEEIAEVVKTESVRKPVEVTPVKKVAKKTEEELKTMTVAALRKFVRDIGKAGLSSEEIRFAKKQDLILTILNVYKK
ncbi:MAG: BMC domain-containing protein [Lachnospiraceae bacterium]|nr:BMC domain-containing protein [Lachnospiraceae bacterium]